MTQRWERGKEAGLGTRLIKEEEGVRYGGAQGGHPMCGTAEEGGLAAAGNGQVRWRWTPIGQTREVALGDSGRWAVARPLICASLMNSSFFDIIQIISTKLD
jgi:hypothetical protein